MTETLAKEIKEIVSQGNGSLLELVLEETKLNPAEEGYLVAKKGIEIFVDEITKSAQDVEKVDKGLVDKIIAGIDEKISLQLDEILHNAKFQEIESAWRGLAMVVNKADFRENIKINMLSVSKSDLLADFEDFPDITKSGLYKHVYTAGYGQFGGEPVGSIVGNYQFDHGAKDVSLLRYISKVSAMAHAPFVGNADAKFLGIKSIQELPNLKDINSILESPVYGKWHGFRESEDARYVGLTLPRVLMRVPYGKDTNPVKEFNYEEKVSGSHEHYLWGAASYAFATRLTESFAKYRWCPNIVGPKSGGMVDDLPLHHFEAMGELQTKIPTEVLISDRREFELSDVGLIPLTMRKGSDNAAFFSANSAQKPKRFPDTKEGKEAETNYKLSTQLPYMYIICRLAHYIKVLQREQIGSWKGKVDLERELNSWIRQYIADQENPSAEVRSRRPLKQASIQVSDVAGEPGWYQVSLEVVPHFKYMGASFTLSLKGKLEKA